MLIYSMIGDLVGSRASGSRARLQRKVIAALTATAEVVPPLDRLEPTVGDEFQGAYESFAEATMTALLIRLALSDIIDVRFGIGVGAREVFDGERTPMLQDGEAWWNARQALDHLGQSAHRAKRTWFDSTYSVNAQPNHALANAFLTARDALVDRLNDRAKSMLYLALTGLTQREIARRTDVSESAVSQAFARGIVAVRDAQLMLASLPVDDPVDGRVL